MFLSSGQTRDNSKAFIFDKENYAWYSPSQMNEYLKFIVEEIQRKTPIFAKLKEFSHYVVLEDEGAQGFFLSGREMVTFSVEVPDVDFLRKKMLSEGLPVSEQLAMSRAIEEEYDRSLMFAYEYVTWYAYSLSRLREVSSLSNEIISSLLEKEFCGIEFDKEKMSVTKTLEQTIRVINSIVAHQSRIRLLVEEQCRRNSFF